MIFQAQFVDLEKKEIYPVEVEVGNGRIKRLVPTGKPSEGKGYLLPGFVDAHVHVESSMMPPTEFARLAVVHGTVATVSDPHEIANVLGVNGVEYMLEESSRSPLKFCFGAPSCVPATTFETAGAALDAEAVEALLKKEEIGYLSEMMNFPGVLFNDGQVLAKIAAAKRLGKPVDGHAPGLMGEDARKYFAAGITTDHECFTYEEGKGKAELGVKILIREGSAARNFEALWPLINEYPDQVMFCSDDKHPDDLIKGHINQLAARAVAKGCDLFDVLRAACIHPVEHYRLAVGQLQAGDPADFVLVKDLQSFEVLETWLDGELVAKNGKSLLPHSHSATPNQFNAIEKQPGQFRLKSKKGSGQVRVIRVLDGEIVTKGETSNVILENGFLQPDVVNDILKISVVNRYAQDAVPAVAFVSGVGLKGGALASSVAHDSHNIVAVGTSDELVCAAVNAVIRAKGGISAVSEDGTEKVLPLPIAGLMSPADGYELAKKYSEIDAWTKSVLGCQLKAPFMALSFLALPVIPSLKMTDLGLFDVGIFNFVELEV